MTSKNKIKKTNAMRILDKEKIEYNIYEYPATDIAMSGVEVADYLGRPYDEIYKTLVLKGDKTGIIVCVIPSNLELDLKKIAIASENKKVDMLPLKDLGPSTGYVHGGCSPIGMKKNYPTYIDSMALNKETIIVSAGKVGKQIEIKVENLLKITLAKTYNIVHI